ncbi:YncE family protein [Phaeobacter sp. B1627]|uniref:YncE family protein n=1 Tax=Phaeobacter sp. B1627 TaxID=2583809 RepID=UPI00111AD232|nr:beta-propeller fold lactonase family protein [Phaeobacter sp. B1627]TNJ47418.1 YncE family protein [Phaeobacter sp. B1627]
MLPRLLVSVAGIFVATVLAADVAYVTCQNGNVLSVIDLETGDQQRWPLPGQPAGIAVSGSGIFVVSPETKEVRRLDPRSGTELARVRLNGGPNGVTVDQMRQRVFVSDWYNARIWVLRAEDLSVIGELETGAAPAGLALSPDGRYLASADRDADQVSIFDAETFAFVARHAVGTRPFGLAFSQDGRLFVGNVGSDDMSVLEPLQGLLTTVAVGARPYAVTFAADRVFVSNQYEDSVSVLNLNTLETITKIDVGEYPEGLDVTPDGASVLVANWFDNTVSRIDVSALKVVAQWETGDGPRAFGAFILAD